MEYLPQLQRLAYNIKTNNNLDLLRENLEASNSIIDNLGEKLKCSNELVIAGDTAMMLDSALIALRTMFSALVLCVTDYGCQIENAAGAKMDVTADEVYNHIVEAIGHLRDNCKDEEQKMSTKQIVGISVGVILLILLIIILVRMSRRR